MDEGKKRILLEKQQRSSRPYRCSWGMCNNDSRYYWKRDSMKNVYFIPFPKPRVNEQKCLRWIKACNRPHEQLNVNNISKILYVCSEHFEGGFGPTEACPDPITADRYVNHQKSNRKRPLDRQNVNNKLPKNRKNAESVQIENDQIITESLPENVEIQGATKETNRNYRTTFIDNIEVTDIHIQCDTCGNKIDLNETKIKHTTRANFVQKIMCNDNACMYYTGIPKVSLLKFLFLWIKPAAVNVKLWNGKTEKKGKGRKRKIMTLFEECLLTLVRIRRGYELTHIAYLFGVSESQASRIFTTWTNVLYRCLRPTILWPSKDIVSQNMPESFKPYPRTRIIIDCTELKIQKPFRPRAQRMTWSNYKHSNTAKILVGIMPSGAFTFVSKVYTGGISDLAIVERSGFVDKIQPGDDVMADRGFNIRHLLIEKKATLNIPAFSHGKRLGSRAVKKSRNIASVRIHVERAIGRMKTFKILGGTIPLRLRFQLNQLITIVCALCNMHDRLA